MPRATRVLSLNLGSQAISMAEFRPRTGGGLVLHEYKRRDVAIESAGESIRPAQITAAVKEMLHEMGIKSGSVNYAVPDESVFARCGKLPSVEGDIMGRSIAIE